MSEPETETGTTEATSAYPATLPYKVFKESRPKPDYDPDYWARCNALYAGGRKLLEDNAVLAKVLPRHNAELQSVYEERCAAAEYIPYSGEIIDRLVAGQFAEPLVMQCEPQADDFYEQFHRDCSPPGGWAVSFHDLMRAQLLTALICKRAWTLIEIPQIDAEPQPQSLAEQEQMGGLNVYACAVDPVSVRDWEMDDDGQLAFALLAFAHSRRTGLTGSRNIIEEEFVYYTATDFARYVISYDRDKPPKGTDPVKRVASGPHSFRGVPVIPLELPDGLWAMGKLENLARAHLRKRSGLSWAEDKSLMPTPTAFVDREELGNKVTSDPKRATKQSRGPNNIVTLGAKDRFEYIGPSPEPFKAMLEDLRDLRDEMHRVTHVMAMSVDNSGAALQRSAASKQVDHDETSAVLEALDDLVAKHAVAVHEFVQTGRGDSPCKWQMEPRSFDRNLMSSLNETALAVDTVSVPSATFQRIFKSTYAVSALAEIGHEVTEDEQKMIEEELEENLSNEMYARPAMAPDGPQNPDEEEPENEDGKDGKNGKGKDNKETTADAAEGE